MDDDGSGGVGLLIWLGFCIWVAVAAKNKGRSGVGWFCIAFIFSPLLGGLALAIAKDLMVDNDLTKVKMEQQGLKDRVVSNEKLTDYRLDRVESYNAKLSATKMDEAISHSQPNLISSDTKLCPVCKEIIKAAAIKCKHCGSMIDKITFVECEYCKEDILITDKICSHCNSEVSNSSS